MTAAEQRTEPGSVSPPEALGELSQLAIVGRVQRTHGVKGDFVVQLFTNAPDVVFASGARVFMGTSTGPEPAAHKEFTVRHGARFQKGAVVHVNGVDDRETADLLRDRFLFVPVDELPPPDDEEVFLHDLIGMHVATTAGISLGEVAGWYEMPQGVMLEVKGPARETLVPYCDEFVRDVDVTERQITVELPEGFLD